MVRDRQGQVNAAGWSPLWLAASLGNLAEVHSLLSLGKVLVDLQDSWGTTPLKIACMNGHQGVAHALLAAGARVDLQNVEGAAICGGRGRPSKQGGCNAAARGMPVRPPGGGARPAVCRGHRGPAVYPGWGYSALDIACGLGDLEVMRALLSAGGRADLLDDSGKTPLDYLPYTLCPQVKRIVQWAEEERGDTGKVREDRGDTVKAREERGDTVKARGERGDTIVKRSGVAAAACRAAPTASGGAPTVVPPPTHSRPTKKAANCRKAWWAENATSGLVLARQPWAATRGPGSSRVHPQMTRLHQMTHHPQMTPQMTHHPQMTHRPAFHRPALAVLGEYCGECCVSFAWSPVGLNVELLKHVCVGFYGS